MKQDPGFLSAAVHLAPIVLFSFDPKGTFSVSDGKGLEILGLKPGEVVGQSVFDVYRDEPSVVENCRRALAGEEFTAISEVRALGLFWETHFVPVRGQGGAIESVVGVAVNVTERVREERRIQASNESLQALAARLRNVQEEERKRISREIHDELGQACAALKIDLSSLKQRLAGDGASPDAKVIEQLSGMLAVIDSTSQRIRDFAQELRPAELDDIGLGAALEWHVRRFEERTGIRCVLDVTRLSGVTSKEKETAIFRIAQEAMMNVARHAGARHLRIELARDDGRIVLVCDDDGTGIAPGKAADPRSLGIIGMRERALALGGTFEIGPAPQGGTRVRASA